MFCTAVFFGLRFYFWGVLLHSYNVGR
uniref:Uncharacterized protein n=1 Tax=Anguilla anguilla TaxID=7936 RepID=A0A0E9XDF2_ANGAN